MRKFTREPEPEFLKGRWKKWGKRYKTNRENNPAFVFQWPMFQGKRINTLLKGSLKSQTNDHCSFCDNFPLGSREDSIDHFWPKSHPEYFEFVCHWENLYYSCQNCQGFKKEQYSHLLLRPDSGNFSFDRFFIYTFRYDTIEPNPTLGVMETEMASVTIEIFGLNDEGHKMARRHARERYTALVKASDDIEINDFPYRYLFD